MNVNTKLGFLLLIAIMASCTAFAKSTQTCELSGLEFTVLANTEFPDRYKTMEISGSCEISRPATRYIGDIVIPETVTADGKNYLVTKIGDAAFSEYDILDGNHLITSVKLPETIEEIGNEAFRNCVLLTDLVLPASVQEIGEYAFANTGISQIEVPEGVTELKKATFFGCDKLVDITLPSTLETIGNEVFYNCDSLEEIELPQNLVTIGDEAFARCYTMTGIKIPDSVTNIGELAFELCSALEIIYLGSGLESIGNHAFMYCSNLYDILSYNLVPPSVFETSFDEIHFAQTRLHVYKEATDDYIAHSVWTKFLVMTGVKGVEIDTPTISVNNRTLTISEHHNTEVAIYDINGNAIYVGTAHEIALSNSGIYIIQVKFDNNRIVKRLHVR